MIEVVKYSKSFKAQNCYGESLANPLLRIKHKNEYLILLIAPQPIPISKGLWQMFPQCLQVGRGALGFLPCTILGWAQHCQSFAAPGIPAALSFHSSLWLQEWQGWCGTGSEPSWLIRNPGSITASNSCFHVLAVGRGWAPPAWELCPCPCGWDGDVSFCCSPR